MIIDIQAAASPQCAHSLQSIQADMRTIADDFQVNEKIDFQLTGEGEHLWLRIQKTSQNTEWLAKKLARQLNVHPRDIGYAGLKDRHAVTSQWFSVHLPGKPDPDIHSLADDNTVIQAAVRHNKKCRRGCHAGNEFVIRLRNLQGDREKLHECLHEVSLQGIPNYFAQQRFGINAENLRLAWQMFTDPQARFKRHQQGIYYSAARSLLFNRILQHRIQHGNWNKALPGDVLMFDRSHACFHFQQQDDDVIRRVQSQQLHPTAVLWGTGELMSDAQAGEIESRIIDNEPVFKEGLCRDGVKQMRRTLRVRAENLQWQTDEDMLELRFELPAGSYATALLNELGAITDINAAVSAAHT